MVAFDFLSIFQCDCFGIWVAVLVSMVLIFPLTRVMLLMLVILMPFGGSLFDSPGVFGVIRAVGMQPNHLSL